MSVTLKDIAAMAGVSVGTVDRALNNRGRVRPEVAERIRTIAAQMNYRTNSIAKSLAMRGKNQKIAVILHIQRNDFFDEVLSGVHRGSHEMQDFGIQVQIYPCRDFDAQEQCRLIDQAICEGANAILIVPIDDPIVTSRLRRLHEEEIPVVLLSSYLSGTPFLSAVHCNYERSGRIAGRLMDMITGGNASFLAFTTSLNMFGHRQRLNGLKSYIADKGSSLTLAEVFTVPNDTIDTYLIAKKALDKHQDIRFALFWGNTRAWMRAVDDCGRSITSIVYDEAPPTREGLMDGRIAAAILQEPAQQGYEAIMTLFRYLVSKTVPDQEILIDNRILLKECID